MNQKQIKEAKKSFFTGISTILNGVVEAAPAVAALGVHYGAKLLEEGSKQLNKAADHIEKS